jgi:phosphoribosyl 1,2-cyclic phosphodiesterase
VIRFASLGSGSAGNALLVESGATCLMVDNGFGQRETTRRLARLERTPENLTGILVTHEHGDHAGGVFAFARQHGLPVWLTHGTWSACAAAATGVDIRIIDSHGSFAFDSLEVCPYPVPHDAREPVQYVFSDGARRLGLLTDVGEITPHVRQVLSGVDGLILECNHDADLLAASDYPPSLQRRISGRLGHLENTVAADLLRGIDCTRLQHLVAAHLSERNNRPELAIGALAGALGCAERWIAVACQAEGFAWRQLA